MTVETKNDTPPVDAPPAETPPAPDPAPVAIESVLADPTPEQFAAAAATVEPAEGAPAEAVGAEPGPAADAGGTAVEPAGEPVAEEPTVEVIVEDGKTVGYKLGQHKAETLEELVVKVEKGRVHAEKLIGKRKEELAAELGEDPFLLSDDDEDEFEIVDDADFAQQISSGIAAALAQSGFGPQQPDPQLMQAQAIQIANQAIQSPYTTDDEFRAVIGALITADPTNHNARQVVLDEWGERRPVAAAQEASRIEIAFAQYGQAQQITAQQEAAQQAYQQEMTVRWEEQKGADEFAFAQQTFVAQHPDWTARNEPMNRWLQQNAWLMERAKETPLVDPNNPADRPRARAVHAVLKMAYEQSGGGSVAGFAPGVSEQGTNMGTVSTPNHVDPVAAARGLAAEQRDLAALETGAAVDEVTIVLANPNPPGLAETSFESLTGIPTVRR